MSTSSSRRIPLSERWTRRLVRMPGHGMGYQLVAVMLKVGPVRRERGERSGFVPLSPPRDVHDLGRRVCQVPCCRG